MIGTIFREATRKRNTSKPFPEPASEPLQPKVNRPPRRGDEQRDGNGPLRIPAGGGYRVLRRPRLLDGED